MELLENKHIRLRALEPEDLASLYRWENDTTLWTVGNTLAPYSRYVLKEYIIESHRDIYDLKQLRLIIEEKATENTLGMVDLFDFDPHNRRAGIGVLLDPLYQRNGWATEALQLLIQYSFSFLKLHQLYVHIPVNNESSISLFERCGFITIGTLTDWIVSTDGYENVLLMQKINTHSGI